MPQEILIIPSREQSCTFPKYLQEVFRSRVAHYFRQVVPVQLNFHRGKSKVYYCRGSL